MRIHGHRLTATDEQALMAMLGLSAGEWGQDEFANWLRQNATAIQP